MNLATVRALRAELSEQGAHGTADVLGFLLARVEQLTQAGEDIALRLAATLRLRILSGDAEMLEAWRSAVAALDQDDGTK